MKPQTLEELLMNAESNLEIFGMRVHGGVEQPFHLPPCLAQALEDIRNALAKIRSMEPVSFR